MPNDGLTNRNNIEPELYFLISQFLKTGPCRKAYQALIGEVEEHKLLPKRLDWLGQEHDRTYEDLVRSHPNIASDHLLKLCQRLGPLLDKENKSNVVGVRSLLGVGKQSLLRVKENENASCQVVNTSTLVARFHNHQLLLPQTLTKHPNITQILFGREMSGPVTPQQFLPTKFYKSFQSFCRRLGHLSSVYCVLFDRTGRYIFTGADDLLVKIWGANDGRLLNTLRGHSAEITDMAVNYENTLLAAGSCDKIIRVWCLKTSVPMAILTGHTAMVTSIKFCPCPKGIDRYLVSTGNDGCIFFWQWNVVTSKFNLQPRKFTERNRPGAQMQSCSFSPGGVFVATGSTDHHVRVYNLYSPNGPERILEMEAHTDRVDSIQFANTSERFVTGSKDGSALIWKFERQSWRKIQLRMITRLPNDTSSVDDNKIARLRVTMVGWDLEDRYVITAVNDHSIKVWNSYTGTLIYHLEGHEDEVFVLESHPTDSRIFLSAGHDGRIILWDLNYGTPIKKFFNIIEGQGHGAVFDCKFSPDGRQFASTDSHGHLSIFGFGSNEKYQKIPTELFFHTDYRPLIRDANHHVLDEQTQVAPHLMPPPFLVNIDGNPYPPEMQRLVPGKENCTDSQLVPLVVNPANGEIDIAEVVRPPENNPPAPGPSSAAGPSSGSLEDRRDNLDVMIERLQREQARDRYQSGPSSSTSSTRPTAQGISSHGRVGVRRSGDVEGVRQSYSNWQSSASPSQGELLAWSRRVVVKCADDEAIRASEWRRLALSELELARYKLEKKRRPITSNGEVIVRKKNIKKNTSKRHNSNLNNNRVRRRAEGGTGWNRYSTNEYENPELMELSSSELSSEMETERRWKNTSSDSSSESSEYSDWTQDAGLNLKPPKREINAASQRKKRIRRYREADECSRRKSKRGKQPIAEIKEEDEEDQLLPSSSTTSKGIPNVNRRGLKMPDWREVPAEYRPSEWLTWTAPRVTPYYPQMGDEVIYFLQGHIAYLKAVSRNKIYRVNEKSQPWHRMHLREQELVKVVGIKYEIRPPRLCCLKLARIDPENGRITDQAFTIKYHDMPDVIDFIVLRQTYDTAMSRNWKAGDKFRALIDNKWWGGTVTSQEPFEPKYPDSMFQCFNVMWDNGENEKMSPWDLEVQVDDRKPTEVGGGVEVLPDEVKQLMWKPIEGEWPPHGIDAECERILFGLSQIMELAVAEPFLAPVDLNSYPLYAYIVEYPIDLSIIKARLENRFYRRIAALQFDVRFVESNTRNFNEPRSKIVQQARMVTELCLRLIEDTLCTDVRPLYQILGNLPIESESEGDNEPESGEDEEEMDDEDNENGLRFGRNRRKRKGGKKEEMLNSNSWKDHCLELIDYFFQCEDSEPFRAPVDPQFYPDYRGIIDNPMDFSTQRIKLLERKYETPIDFCKDSRLIFQNSRNYNTNKRSRIYSMTIRMSAMFEEHIRLVISDWKSAVKYEQKVQNNCFVTDRRRPLPRALPDLDSSSRRTRSHDVATGSPSKHNSKRRRSKRPVRRKNASRKSSSSKRRIASSEDEVDDEEDKIVGRAREPRRQSRRTAVDRSKKPLTDRVSNGHVRGSRSKTRESQNASKQTIGSDSSPEDDDEDGKGEVEEEVAVEGSSEHEEEEVNVEDKASSSSSSSDDDDDKTEKARSAAPISNLRSGRKFKGSGDVESVGETNGRSSRKCVTISKSDDNSNSSSASNNNDEGTKNSRSSSSSSSTSSSSSSGSGGSSSSSGSNKKSSDKEANEEERKNANSSSNEMSNCESDLGVRRSKRTTTRNSTKATTSALHSMDNSRGQVRVCEVTSSGGTSAGSSRRRSRKRHLHASDSESEESEEEDDNSARRSKRIATKKRSVRYREDSDFEYEFNSEESEESTTRLRSSATAAANSNPVSISSRGRVRKLTQVARKYIRT